MDKLASFSSRVLCKSRLIFSRIHGHCHQQEHKRFPIRAICGKRLTTSTSEYDLAVLRPENFEDTIVFMEKHFIPREPLSLGLHIVDMRPREGLISEIVSASLRSGMSVGARIKTNGELAGIALNIIEDRDEYDRSGRHKPEVELVQAQEDVMTLLGLANEGIDRFGSEKKLVSAEIICVAEEHAEKGLGAKLAKECIQLAVAAGINRSIGTATNTHNVALLKQFGFQIVNVLDLTQLGEEYKGRPLDFDRMNGNNSLYIVVKQGFP